MSALVEKRNLTTEIVESIGKENLDAFRKEALKRLTDMQLPSTKSEEYRFAPVTRILEKQFPTWPSHMAGNITQFDVASVLPTGMDAEVVVLVNGVWSKELSQLKHTTIQLAGEQPSIASSDPFVILNAAAASESILIEVAAGHQAELPLVLVHLNDASKQGIAASTSVKIVLQQGSKVSVIHRSVTLGDQPVFLNTVEHIEVGPKAHLDYYKIQDAPGKFIQVATTLVRQQEESQVNTFTLTMDGLAIRNNLTILIDGEHCESHFHGLYLLKGETLADNHTVVDHLKPNSFSNEMYKGVMDDQSKGVFNGKIFVRPYAQKTNAFQSNRNILLSEQATINTKPQLEIWADDVKCSHGCTTGQLDEEALFYLRARGIPKETARAMLLYAFASEVLQVVPENQLRDYMDRMISERLHKDF